MDRLHPWCTPFEYRKGLEYKLLELFSIAKNQGYFKGYIAVQLLSIIHSIIGTYVKYYNSIQLLRTKPFVDFMVFQALMEILSLKIS